jgi:hypothetical protein
LEKLGALDNELPSNPGGTGKPATHRVQLTGPGCTSVFRQHHGSPTQHDDITNEPTLTSSVDNARGALIIRIFTEKGRGPARNQTLLTTAVNVLETLNNTAKTSALAHL